MHRSFKACIQPNKESKEREKVLQQKLGELTNHIQRLEHCMTLLRADNESLRKRQMNQRPIETKFRSHTNQNGDLPSSARRFDQKAQSSHRGSSKVKPSPQQSVLKSEVNPEVETLKRTFAQQRAIELSRYNKNLQAKDKEIDDLRKKYQELANKLCSNEIRIPQNAAQFAEKEEFVHIIKIAAKERLQLEHELAHHITKEIPVTGSSLKQYCDNRNYQNEREVTDESVPQKIAKLEQALNKAENLEQQLKEKSNECLSLSKELSQTKHHLEQVESKHSSALSEIRQLTCTISDLQGQVESTEKITEECNTLKLFLATTQKEKETAEEEVKLLSRRVQSLENVVRDLQEAAENINQLENDRKTALQQLLQKQAQLEELQQINSNIEAMHSQTVLSLNKLVCELDEKMKTEEEKRMKLSKEMQRLQKEAAEREKVLAELECAKQGLVKSHQEMNLISVQEGNINGIEVSRNRMQRRSWNQHEQQNESLLSIWAQKGPIQVYIAKYNYDPFELSPNENPEAELPLTAGDYVLVVGEMDEDGFFDGELIDGTQGLVPSNFIQRVEDEDLLDFHAALLHVGHQDYSNIVKISTNLRMSTSPIKSTPVIFSNLTNNNVSKNKDLYFLSEERRHSEADVQNGTGDGSSMKSNSEDLPWFDEESVLGYSTMRYGEIINNFSLAPYPRSLSLDKQLPNSLQISWRGPDPTPSLKILSYHILVDGKFKALVKSNERTRTVLEDISDCDTHRICVQCLSNRGQSAAAHCTLLIGKDSYPVPSDLKISQISSTSAFLSWLPGNSNYQHSIVVNGKEITVVKPGVYFYTLSDLASGTLYKVTVIAKSISGILSEESSIKWVQNTSASIEFCTSEADPAVFRTEDTENLIQTDLSVQTCSSPVMEYIDSELVQPPQSQIKDVAENSSSILTKSNAFETLELLDGEQLKGPDTDEEIEEAFKEYWQNEGIDVLSESYSNSSCTQLSDIAEVEEDLIGSQDSHLNEAGTTLTDQMPSLRQSQSHMTCQVETKSSEQITNTLVPNSDPKGFHTQKAIQDGGKLLAAPVHKVPDIDTVQKSDIDEAILTIEEDTTSSQHNKSINLSKKRQIGDTETSSHDTRNSQNLSAFVKMDTTEQRYITDAKQIVEVEGKSLEKYNYSYSLLLSSKTHSAIDNPHICRDDLVSSKPKNKQRRNQRPLSDSVLSSEYTKYLTKLASPIHPLDQASDSGSVSGEVDSVVKANSVRLFIALFDYDPATMSPNVDSTDEELPFREGQILKVFGHKDADGFYKGENNGRMGYIPCNMVCEIQISDSELLEQLLQDIAESPRHSKNVTGDQSNDKELILNGVISSSKEGSMPRMMVALYDYDPKQLSPNVDAELELSFKTGDSVAIYGDMDEDGFYIGEVNNKRGLVPSNYLQPAPSSDKRWNNTSLPGARTQT